MNNKTNWIAHHGIEGQKWGVRRYQNKDGSLTSAGRRHRTLFEDDMDREIAESKADDRVVLNKRSQRRQKISDKYNAKIEKKYNKEERDKINAKYDKKLNKTKKSDKIEKINQKRNEKLSKYDTTKLQNKKEKKLSKYDSETNRIKAGQDRYNRTLEEYRDETVKTFKNATYTKNPQYLRAVANYKSLKLNDLLGSSRNTKEGYGSGNSNIENLVSDAKDRYEDEKWWREH